MTTHVPGCGHLLGVVPGAVGGEERREEGGEEEGFQDQLGLLCLGRLVQCWVASGEQCLQHL